MFQFPVRVYYSDTDAEGIVYHARYLDFAEHARTEMLRTVGIQQSASQKAGTILVVSSITIDFKRPGYLDDLLTVETEVETAKVFSLVLKQTIRRGDEVLALLSVKVASINVGTKCPAPLERGVIEAIKAL
ncbi:MAG: YbgC/FadM family acyl-CoA thioesterase [Sphaerochaetaceae bacterium]|jgi:acyl-CoA thioester hydrolase|nr:YbgC/FadM family acyl-CoA thioesterase [Spirochaetaceae bacterium]MDY6343067.1 YbgC/FadM family acyl-CoA thioesterase [Sphaerochaetaceae bacterium]